MKSYGSGHLNSGTSLLYFFFFSFFFLFFYKNIQLAVCSMSSLSYHYRLIICFLKLTLGIGYIKKIPKILFCTLCLLLCKLTLGPPFLIENGCKWNIVKAKSPFCKSLRQVIINCTIVPLSNIFSLSMEYVLSFHFIIPSNFASRLFGASQTSSALNAAICLMSSSISAVSGSDCFTLRLVSLAMRNYTICYHSNKNSR